MRNSETAKALPATDTALRTAAAARDAVRAGSDRRATNSDFSPRDERTRCHADQTALRSHDDDAPAAGPRPAARLAPIASVRYSK